MQPCHLFVSIPFVIGEAGWDGEPVYPNTAPEVKRAYLNAVLAEMRGFADDAGDLDIASLTFGTGSLSTVPEADLRDFLTSMRGLFSIAPRTPIFASFDPGLISIGQVNELKAFGDPRLEFRYLTSNVDEAFALGMPMGETEMKKTDIVLENAGLRNVGIKVAVGIAGQTTETLEKTLRDANRSIIDRFELVAVREGFGRALPDDDAAALLGHACSWLERHGFGATTPVRFVREGAAENPVQDLRFAAGTDAASTAILSFGPSTLSVFDGMLWANTGDLATYLAKSNDPAAITKEVIKLDDHAKSVRQKFDTLYRGCGSMPFDEVAHASLLDAGFLTWDGGAQCSERSAVRLSEKGRLRYEQVLEQLARALA